MCWLCDHPDASPADYLEVLRDKARRNGWALQYVEDPARPFAYTVGLNDVDMPELMVTGLPPSTSSWLLRCVIQEAMLGAPLVPGCRMCVDGGPEIEIVEVDHPDVHLCWAVNHAQGPIRALQVVWTDRCGRWPWSQEFCGGHGCQPVLGVRARAA
ncbi:DUF4262 domain-containing protein [Mycolicibacterium sp. BiH015]|uniref:DUF4262 domain-containing protein n=1 Tax=Mycolicibacterium sp. BiH015 TaxID=3018808 RepID=UPI0022E0E33A|nr:DUF4262 domain-containing protein [Mycolicibacterium sp. BiH015]MDA2894097.1 DUF4262 domain-containing protein [Mycolicibacterium sp. BiH015]